MVMIPDFELLRENIEVEDMPTYTHKYDFTKTDTVKNYTDSIEAMKQAVYLIINTERYKHVIYSHDYGVELADLFGRAISYVYPVAKQRIKDALEWDDRIDLVDSFSYEVKKKGELSVYFTVHTIFGSFDTEKVVKI